MSLKALRLCTSPRVPEFHHPKRVARNYCPITVKTCQHYRSRKANGKNHPKTPTVQTSVRSPRILSVLILSSVRPVAISHFLRLLSDPPVTNHESAHSNSSSSSLSLSDPAFEAVVRRTIGGPHAMLRSRHFTRSNLRWCSRVLWRRDISRTDPSSHPRASIVDAGLAAIDQIAPPWELMLFCHCLISILFEDIRKGAYFYAALFCIPFYKFTTTSRAK